MTEDTNRTMKDVDHTHPFTGETAGHLFTRGPIVAADGGHDPKRSRQESDEDDESKTMKDVSHTPPHDAEDANRTFERGVTRGEEKSGSEE